MQEALYVSAASAYIGELTGHRPNPATVTRWIQQGRLRSWRVGRRLLTDRAAVRELVEGFNRPRAAEHLPPEPRRDVQQAGAEAAERIARMGA